MSKFCRRAGCQKLPEFHVAVARPDTLTPQGADLCGPCTLDEIRTQAPHAHEGVLHVTLIDPDFSSVVTR
jgi:hypothetical protein